MRDIIAVLTLLSSRVPLSLSSVAVGIFSLRER